MQSSKLDPAAGNGHLAQSSSMVWKRSDRVKQQGRQSVTMSRFRQKSPIHALVRGFPEDSSSVTWYYMPTADQNFRPLGPLCAVNNLNPAERNGVKRRVKMKLIVQPEDGISPLTKAIDAASEEH